MNILDSIRETFTDTSKVVVQKAKDVTEITRLLNKLSAEEYEIKQACLAIGKKYYQEHRGEMPAGFEKDFEQIYKSEEIITALKEKIHQLKGVHECEKCSAEVSKDASYCSRCGAKIEREDIVQEKAAVDIFAAEGEESYLQEQPADAGIFFEDEFDLPDLTVLPDSSEAAPDIEPAVEDDIDPVTEAEEWSDDFMIREEIENENEV